MNFYGTNFELAGKGFMFNKNNLYVLETGTDWLWNVDDSGRKQVEFVGFWDSEVVWAKEAGSTCSPPLHFGGRILESVLAATYIYIHYRQLVSWSLVSEIECSCTTALYHRNNQNEVIAKVWWMGNLIWIPWHLCNLDSTFQLNSPVTMHTFSSGLHVFSTVFDEACMARNLLGFHFNEMGSKDVKALFITFFAQCKLFDSLILFKFGVPEFFSTFE